MSLGILKISISMELLNSFERQSLNSCYVTGAGDTAVTRPRVSSAGDRILVGKMDVSKFTNAHRGHFREQ